MNTTVVIGDEEYIKPAVGVWHDRLRERMRAALPRDVASKLMYLGQGNTIITIAWKGGKTSTVLINELFNEATIARLCLECP